mgnify:CR=1 FL=1
MEDCEGDEFSVGEFGGDPDGGSGWCLFWVVAYCVVDGHVKCCGEGVQVGVHTLVLQGRCLFSPLILDALAR